jgi:hypothetical protein
MPDRADVPSSGEEAQRWSMARLRRALFDRQNNEHVREWEEINTRNNFAPGIAASMRKPGMSQ